MKTRTGTAKEGPTFCWQCDKKLRSAPGKGEGLYFFDLVLGDDGHQHRVHGRCVKRAEDDGHKLIPNKPKMNEWQKFLTVRAEIEGRP
jgi:hypothetical protein